MTAQKKSFVRPEFSPLSILRMVWKQKFLIGFFWVVVTAITVAVVYRLPAVYSAEATILVDSQKIPEKWISSTVSSDVQDRITSISQQILSAPRLRKLIDDFGLYREERKTKYPEEILMMMRRDISIRVDRGTGPSRQPGSFHVGYQGKNPVLVAQVANQIANFYIEENMKTREIQAEGTSEFIDSQLAEAKEKLETLEATVSEYKRKHNGELPQQENALMGTIGRLQMGLQANRDAINRAEDSKVVLENSLAMAENSVSDLLQASKSNRTAAALPAPANPALSEALGVKGPKPQKSSDVLQAQLDLLRIRYSDEHPDVKRLRAEIVRVKALEEKEAEQAALTPPPAKAKDKGGDAARVAAAAQGSKQAAPSVRDTAVIEQARERVSALKAQLALLNKDMDTRKAEQDRILHDMNVYQSRIDNLPIREQEMAKVLRDYEISKGNYSSLLSKKIAAEMATDMERRQKAERFTIIDPATVPFRPYKPDRPSLILLGSIVGMGLGLVVGLGKEFRKEALLGEWELPANIVVLGRLPMIHISAPGNSHSRPQGGLRNRVLARKWIVSSAVLSLLGIVAAYYVSHRF